MAGCLKICTISDIHIGASDDKNLYDNLKEFFFKNIKEDIPDMIVICGDISHDTLSLNSQSGKVYLKFAKKLISLCSKYNIILRIVKGTQSHDRNQLEVFNIQEYEGELNVRIFNTVTEEETIPGYKFLYIPEEYVNDKDKYYGEYFNKEYDMIFMHGLVSDAAFIAKHQESESSHPRAPIFNTDDLLNLSIGPVVAGHIHGHCCFKDRFFYTGSFTRWQFGEEESKGYMRFKYYKRDRDFEMQFIENTNAPIYKTIKVDMKSGLYNMGIDRTMKELLRIKEEAVYDKLRFLVTIPEDYSEPQLFSDSIKELFSLYKNIVVKINSLSKSKQEAKVKEQIEILLKTYDYIFEEKITYSEKIKRFISTKFGKEIDIEEIDKYIYK